MKSSLRPTCESCGRTSRSTCDKRWADDDESSEDCIKCAQRAFGQSRHERVLTFNDKPEVYSSFTPYARIYSGVHPRDFVFLCDGRKLLIKSSMPSKTSKPSQHVAYSELKEERGLAGPCMQIGKTRPCATTPVVAAGLKGFTRR